MYGAEVRWPSAVRVGADALMAHRDAVWATGMKPPTQPRGPMNTSARDSAPMQSRPSVNFRAEQEALRKEMRESGLNIRLIAAEMSRRYGLRPRTAYRIAHGWTLAQAANDLNERAPELGLDRQGHASMSAPRVHDYEKWPHGGRRPSVRVLTLMAYVYGARRIDLLDWDDLQELSEEDRAKLLPDSSQPRR